MAYQTSASAPVGIPETLHACFPGQTSQKFFYSSDIDYPIKIKVYAATLRVLVVNHALPLLTAAI